MIEMTEDLRALGLGCCALCARVNFAGWAGAGVRVWRCSPHGTWHELAGKELARELVERAHRCPGFVEAGGGHEHGK